MIELPLIFLSGLLGSSHCIGMCGAFAMSIGMGSSSSLRNLTRQIVYTLGRIFTYSFAGIAAAFVGLRLIRGLSINGGFNVQAILALLAGILLIVQGLNSLGVRWPWRAATTSVPCGSAKFLRTFLTAPGLMNVFLAGVLTGLLPCGLVYANLLLATSTVSLWRAALLMAVFGAGTAPLMIVTGWGASLLPMRVRQMTMNLAAVCVVLTGVLSIYRGGSVLAATAAGRQPNCPMCVTRSAGELAR